MSNFLKIGDAYFIQGHNGELTAVSDRDTLKGLKTGQLQHTVKPLTSKLRFDNDLTPDNNSTGRSLQFANEPAQQQSQPTVTPQSAPADDLKNILKETIKSFAGAKDINELEQRRQSLLREQMLKAPYSEEGDKILSASQKLALMRNRGAELEPEIKQIEDQILQSKQAEHEKIADLVNLQKLAEGLGMLGEGQTSIDPTSDMKEFLYAKEQGAFDGNFLDWQRTMANLKAPRTTVNMGLTPTQLFDRELKLANNFQKYAKEANTAVRQMNVVKAGYESAMKNLKEGKPLGAQSQAVVIGFNKMLDPISVVRESEYARTPEGASLLNRLEGQIIRFQQGGVGLNAAELQNIYDIASAILDGYKRTQLDYAELIDHQAKSIGADLNNVLPPSVVDAYKNDKSTVKKIRVRRNSDGVTGTLPEDEFDPNLYTKI